VTDLIQTLCALIGAVGGVLTMYQILVQLRQLREDQNRREATEASARIEKQAEWLWQMSLVFYTDSTFSGIRVRLEASEGSGHIDFIDDYYNFLETVAVFKDMRQFEAKYANAIFGYWVEALNKPEIIAYLDENRYAHLSAWVRKEPYDAAAAERRAHGHR
jgi:hypothetical protein